MHLESVSNGLGAPSMRMLIMAIRGEIPATHSITADTGWENDRLWNTGRRSTAREYFDSVVVPLCHGSHVTTHFVRKKNRAGVDLPSLRELLMAGATRNGSPFGVPMFGSRGGRAMQSCTDKMKIGALRQKARELGATTNCNAQGLHVAEYARRGKCCPIAERGAFTIHQTRVKTKNEWKTVRWQTHYYPLADLGMKREDIYRDLDKEGVPYLISSECDACPHQDLARWERHTPEVIEDAAQLEALFNGNYFFTDRRIPLKQAIAAMQRQRDLFPKQHQDEMDFGCNNSICGV